MITLHTMEEAHPRRKYIGQKIKAAREDAGLSQRDAAKLAHMRQQSWLSIEKGRTKVDFADLERIGRLLDKPVSWFLPQDYIDPAGLSPDLAEIVHNINGIDDDKDRRALTEHVKQFLKMQKEFIERLR